MDRILLAFIPVACGWLTAVCFFIYAVAYERGYVKGYKKGKEKRDEDV